LGAAAGGAGFCAINNAAERRAARVSFMIGT